MAEQNSKTPLGPRFLALMEPDVASVERVKTRAVSAGSARRSRRPLVVAIVAFALVTVVGGGYSLWWQSPSQVETVTVLQGNDDLLLVQTGDGRQWVLGPTHTEPAPGTMELVLEGGH